MDSSKVKITQNSSIGMLWFVGWLFTIGFLGLGFWKGLLGLIVWPYFLGVHFSTWGAVAAMPAVTG